MFSIYPSGRGPSGHGPFQPFADGHQVHGCLFGRAPFARLNWFNCRYLDGKVRGLRDVALEAGPGPAEVLEGLGRRPRRAEADHEVHLIGASHEVDLHLVEEGVEQPL